MFNPNVKYAKSKGVDLPLMYVYLAGYMSGEKLTETMEWRKTIRKHYREWEKQKISQALFLTKESYLLHLARHGEYESLSYPISFLDPYNGKEFKTIDKKGLTSSIPANAIYDGDRMSVNKADIIVANMNDFFLEGLNLPKYGTIIDLNSYSKNDLYRRICFLEDKIQNYRPSIGTIFEICWAMEQRKPIILIVPENKKEIYEKHPFTCRASHIVGSVDELLEKKVLETFYRRMAGAIY